MTVIAAALKHLLAAGVSGDDLVRAVEEMEEALRPRRSSGAERQAAYRERKKAEEDVTSDVTNVTDVTSRNGLDPSPKKQKSIPLTQSPPLYPPFPLAEALAVWNEMADRTGLPKALSGTGKRQAAMKARLAEHGEEGFRKAVAAVERSKFCRGENRTGWRADIGFMLRPDNFLKLMEGGFDSAAGPSPVGTAANRPMNAEELRNAIRYAEDHDNPERAAECKRMLVALQAKSGSSSPQVQNLISRTAGAMRQ